jgi:hypothetical protein
MTEITQRIQTVNTSHKRRCIAAMLHERTRAGKPTTIREIATAYNWDANQVTTTVRLMVGEIVETAFGPVIVQHVGQRTSFAGVTANIYAAILHHENPAEACAAAWLAKNEKL